MKEGARSLLLAAYEVPRAFYGNRNWQRGFPSAAKTVTNLGVMIWFADSNNRVGNGKRRAMDVDALVTRWKQLVVNLATAHDKAEADRWEASVEECLTPILAAPIKQVRELANKLLTALREDPTVPYLVWRSFEVWIAQMKDAPDEDVKELKTALAQEIVALVETDAKEQLPDAMIRALQWRSPAQLEDPTRDANIIVQRAAELADLRDAMLAEKFSTLDAALREEE